MKRKKIRILIIGVSSAAFVIAGIAGFFIWRSYVIKAQEARSYQMARDLLAASRPAEALAIIRAKTHTQSDAGYEKWLALEISALVKQRNVPRLLYLFEKDSKAFMQYEDASLLVCRALLQMKSMGIYQPFRDAWRAHETQYSAWFALDADALIQEGKTDEALTFLLSRSFEGPSDSGRLIRLALLKAGEDLNAAWNLLDNAYAANPRNADVRSFRAQILERVGKIGPARVEYVAAFLSDTQNPIFRDQLAEFYRRQGKFDLALKTWADGLSGPSLNYLWLKTLFWSRVSTPVALNWNPEKQPSGPLRPFVEYLLNLPDGRFWDSHAFSKIPGSQRLLVERQEFFWLQVLQALKEGKETRAMDLLKTNPFKDQSWHPELEQNLKNLLTYRQWGVFVLSEEDDNQRSATPRHQFFDQISFLSKKRSHGPDPKKIPNDLKQLIVGDEAFTALFLAGGWLEAALQLHRNPVITKEFPPWFVYGLTQAFRYNRGIKPALDFAVHQSPTPTMDLLIAELLIADGRIKEGLDKLAALADDHSDVGFRAAWLLCLARLDQGQIKEAKHIVGQSQPLKNSLIGKEILARIAFDEGRMDAAEKMYGALVKESVEAKTFLAARAFEKGDWSTARKRTQELLMMFPDNMQLRGNLDAIAREEEKNEKI